MTLFNRKKDLKTTLVEAQIEEVTRQMDTVTADSPEYAAMVKQLIELYKIKEPNSSADRRALVLALAPVAAQVLIVALIMGYEQRGHSFTSKAAAFIRKP